MTLGSLFDGIGGWLLAAQRAGVTPVWGAEISPFCCRVTATHFPDVAQLGNIKNISNPPYVDIITAGSPCQDLSVAGLRKGLGGERSGLFFNAIRIVRAVKSRYFVWENVLGAFNSNDGRDFQAVLSAITATDIPLPRDGKWSCAGVVDGDRCQVAWRVLDAQYRGVPQRRKRIFLVASFGTQCAAEILFEPEGVCRHSQTGTVQGQKDSTGVTASPTLASAGVTPLVMPRTYGQQKYYSYAESTLGSTLRASGGTFGGGSETLVCTHKVRRLTPLECERLQGLPDNWTLIDDKLCCDKARYTAIGNAMAQPCADFIIRRIAEHSERG